MRRQSARSSSAIRARSAAISTAQLLGALGRRRLQRERTQPLPHLLLDVPRALDLHRDPRELQLGPMPAPLELPEPAASSTSARRSSGFEASTCSTLPWPTIECIAEPSPTSARSSTRSVRRTAARFTRYWPSAPRTSRRAIETSLKSSSAEGAVLVVEDELHLAVLGPLAVPAAREEDVVRLLGPELGRRQRPGRPDDRVGDVRLPGAVRADDDGDARLERDLERVGGRT